MNTNTNTINNISDGNRKYPVDWLLGIGKQIKDPPNHPKDDIPRIN